MYLKKDYRILFLEISCPADVNVLDKEDEKVSKYQALAREMSITCGHHSYCIWSFWDSILPPVHTSEEAAVIF